MGGAVVSAPAERVEDAIVGVEGAARSEAPIGPRRSAGAAGVGAAVVVVEPGIGPGATTRADARPASGRSSSRRMIGPVSLRVHWPAGPG